jgi:hypothetical protein
MKIILYRTYALEEQNQYGNHCGLKLKFRQLKIYAADYSVKLRKSYFRKLKVKLENETIVRQL